MVDQLPAAPSDESPYGDALREEMSKLGGKSIPEIAVVLNERREEKENLEKALKDTNLCLEAATRVLLNEMETQQVDSIKTAGYSYSRSPEPYPQTTDREALRAWALAEMPDNLALPFQTLRALTKQRLEDGDALPPGVEAFIKWGISRRKA
jgi:hypothetical protein